jgi:iron(III) transport system substrate-binding protein
MTSAPEPVRTSAQRSRLRLHGTLAALLSVLALGACAPEPDVVVYCALDQVFSEELLRQFERESGLRVRAEFDIEAQKTVGLVQRIREESARPRCDVFWNNEIAHTVSLAEEGLLASYDSPSAAGIPAGFRDPQARWTGFAARARVFIVNTELADPDQIHGLDDLLDPRWAEKVCMARPLTGTTLTHVTALYTTWGEERTRDWLARANAEGSPLSFVQSNGQVMRLVSEGQMAWGLTDTDDFNVALEKGAPVVAVFPDQGEGQDGTLLIPNTVAILAAAPHPAAARKLVDFILSRQVEERLAASPSAQIPVRADVPRPEHVRSAAELRVMAVDWAEVGRQIQDRAVELGEMFRR